MRTTRYTETASRFLDHFILLELPILSSSTLTPVPYRVTTVGEAWVFMGLRRERSAVLAFWVIPINAE
jgi:hypothetical protein